MSRPFFWKKFQAPNGNQTQDLPDTSWNALLH